MSTPDAPPLPPASVHSTQFLTKDQTLRLLKAWGVTDQFPTPTAVPAAGNKFVIAFPRSQWSSGVAMAEITLSSRKATYGGRLYQVRLLRP